MLASDSDFRRRKVTCDVFRPVVVGDVVRHWAIGETEYSLFPYTQEGLRPLSDMPYLHKWIWPARTSIGNRATFGGLTYFAEGRPWWAWHQIALERLQPPLTITFGFVSTHNHFAIDQGGKVFKQTAPVVKLKAGATFAEHTTLLGVLNSSTACFWLKCVVQAKSSFVEAWETRFEFDSTKLGKLPIPALQPSQLPTALVQTSTALQGQSPTATLASWGGPESGDLRPWLASARDLATRHRRQLIAWQEELDWQIYEAFGLVEGAAESGPAAVSLPEGAAVDAIPPEGIELGQRAFEIVLARRMEGKDELGRMKEEGEPLKTTWFARHGSTPITAVPAHWPKTYRELVERRIALIASDPNIRLIEQPEYKRRWNTEPWDEQFQTAAKNWLLARLEGYFFEGQRVCDLNGSFDSAAHGFTAASRPHLVSANQLADIVQTDRWFMEVAENFIGGSGFSVPKLVRELVESAAVPYLPILRYRESGLRKRHDWEMVWNLQRREDWIDAQEKVDEPEITDLERLRRKASAAKRKKDELGDIPVPPKYTSADFTKTGYWSLRGKLDVPKERWVSYPGAQREGDDSLLIAWAGWDHLQQAQALAEYLIDAKDNRGWSVERLKPLLAGLADLIPWLKQWHNSPDPNLGMGLGDYFAGFLEEQCRTLGITVEQAEKARYGE